MHLFKDDALTQRYFLGVLRFVNNAFLTFLNKCNRMSIFPIPDFIHV